MNADQNLKLFVSILFLLGAMLLAACNNQPPTDSESSPKTETMITLPTLDSTPITPTPEVETDGTVLSREPMREETTGIPEVDRAVEVVLGNDPGAKLALVQLTTAGCTKELGLGGPPKCESDQVQGTPVEYLPVLGPGEGMTALPEAIGRVLDFRVQALYLTYSRLEKPADDPYYSPGAYTLVFTTNETESVPFIAVRLNEEGRIVRVDFMAWEPESIMEQEAWKILVQPPITHKEEMDLGGSTPTPPQIAEEDAGQILNFSAISNMERPGPGDTIELKWETRGDTARICVSYGGWVNRECFDVFPSGQQTITLRTEDPVADHWVDIILTLRDEFSTIDESVRIPLQCHYQWFEEDLSSWCPHGPVDESEAFAQEFESGVAITKDDTATVFFDEPGDPCKLYFVPPELEFEVDQPQPPPDRFRPGEGMAILWQGVFPGTEDLRPRLGWPTSAPINYLMKQQCERTPDGQGDCFASALDGNVFIPPSDVVVIPDPGGASNTESVCQWVDRSESEIIEPTPMAGDSQCTPPVALEWAYRDLVELSSTIRDAFRQANLEGVKVRAIAFGEEGIDYNEATEKTVVCGFLFRETDFRVTIPVNYLSDREELGELLARVILVLNAFPPDDTPGPVPGQISVTFMGGDGKLFMRFSVLDAAEAMEDGLSGVDLFETLHN